jgi:hypothetical protein
VVGGVYGRGAPTPPAPAVVQTETLDELVARLLPREREEVTEEVQRQAEAVRGVEGREGALAAIDWDRVLRTLQVGKAAGLDGWRAEHFISLMAGGRELARRVAEAVRRFAEVIYAGRVAAEARPLLIGARVAFIPKVDGTPRLLGVVSMLRRLITRPAVGAVTPRYADFLVRRGQLGVGAPAGTEALARRAQQAYDAGKGVLVLDRTNAYPRMAPRPARKATEKLVPELGGLLGVLLGGPAVVMGLGIADYEFTGVFIGCPSSPVVYAVGNEVAIDPVREDLEEWGVDTSGYLDDGALAADEPDALARGYAAVEREGAKWGQEINLRKSKLLVKAEVAGRFAGVLDGVPRVSSMNLVGVPVGEDGWREEACLEVVKRTTRARRRLAARLPKVAAYYLLRKSDGFPKLVHVFRGVPAALTQRAAEQHDQDVEEEMARMAGTIPAGLGALRERTWLPLRVGGAAVTSARLVAGAAYAASAVQVQRLMRSMGSVARQSEGPLDFQLARESGRPVPSWTTSAVSCLGEGRCKMARAAGCARGCCAVCCAVQGACTGCRGRVQEARRGEEVRAMWRDEGVKTSLRIAAEAGGVEVVRVEDAFAVAAEYRAPQRAVTCALLLVRFLAMRKRLEEAGKQAELRVLRGCAELTHYAAWLILPLERMLSDAAFLPAMRRLYGLEVLQSESLRCKTIAGKEGKTCPVKGVRPRDFAKYAAANPRAADDHALMCKCGGGGIHTHDGYVIAYAATVREWGVSGKMESRRFLPGGKRMDHELTLAGDPGTVGFMCDFTRRHLGGEVELRSAEEAKEKKYNKLYTAPVTMRGAAFNDLGVMGKGCMEAVDRAVAEGVISTGSHPADLKLEMLGRLSCAVMRGNAASFAYFAEVNNERGGFAPRPGALEPCGRRRALGVTGTLTGTRGRGRPRGKVTAKRAQPASEGTRRAERVAAEEEGDSEQELRRQGEELLTS